MDTHGIPMAPHHRAVTDRFIAACQADERVVAATLYGSYARGPEGPPADAYSDLDLGLIITDIENPYFPQLVRAVEDAARAAGYLVLLCNAADDPEREASYLDLLVDRRVDGLIVAASNLGARQSEWLTAPPIPVVLVNTDAPRAGVPAIMSDNTGGARLATEHLLALGHRRFGYLMPPPRNVDAPARLAGVRAALREAGCPADALTIAHGEGSEGTRDAR